MKLCPQCGVELDEHMQVCPLCKYSDFDRQTDPKDIGIVHGNEPGEKLLSDYVKLTKNQKRKLFWELSGIILFSGILVTLIIDVVTSKTITWSRYSITICLVLFFNTTLLSFLRHKLLILLGGSFLSTSLLLVLLDLYNERIGWGTQLGIPLLFSLYLIIFVLAVVIRLTKQHGFNILGCCFLAVGLLCLCIDGIQSRYLTEEISFHWSLIVFVCLVPIAAILFYIHYRLNRGIELRRFFHI
jgi:hypothetical protein